MAVFKAEDRVEHVSEASLGVGVVKGVEEAIAGQRSVYVSWSGVSGRHPYTESQLRVVDDLATQLGNAGPVHTVPFQLRVLGRWFQARHERTGEITNQPFDMLPHQVVVTSRVISSPPAADGGRHWLIADDVGLGKTIEAGMILEVMRNRAGGSLRCLVVVPAGLVDQWQVELQERFGRVFYRFDATKANELQALDQMVASISTLKKPKSKKAALEAHPWDLVIFDESHHLTKPGVLMYELAKELREKKKARNTLFLSATPHSGNSAHFRNMLHLLRPDIVESGTGGPDLPIAALMIRNRKHTVTDAKGEKIFHGIAGTKIISIHPTEAEVEFAEEVKNYLKHGYKEAGKLSVQKRKGVGFMMTTFGKLASSSRQALKSGLQKRLEVLRKGGNSKGRKALIEDEDIEDAALAESAKRGLESATENGVSLIHGEVKYLADLLDRLEKLPGHDSKLEGFAAGLKDLIAGKPGLKVLIFTEYRATQDALKRTLAGAFGDQSVGEIHGSMRPEDRKKVVEKFNGQDQPRFIVSTAAGGEGLNMQRRCHTIVNYDLPWNPNVLQQRIGRLYRYGQTVPVVVWNLKVETPSEAYADNRVYQYLDKKLREIEEQLAAAMEDGEREDLLGDVLGQAAVEGLSLEELYQTLVEQGEKKAEETIDQKAHHLKRIMENPEVLGMFKGLPRFSLEDYKKVESRVTSEHLEFFVKQYCENARLGYRDEGGKCFSFTPSTKLAEIAEEKKKRDHYAVAGQVSTDKVKSATVDKEVAQGGARLLRFGDPVFEAMVRHVQYRDFSAVASLDMSAAHLGWARAVQGTWMLFELQVKRTEGKESHVVRREITSFVVPVGGAAAESKPELIEHVNKSTKGPGADVDEARRARELGREAAGERLRTLMDEVRKDYPGDQALQPVPVSEVALAWVRAV